MKAFLGMGLLGSNFVKAMRRRGEEVQVWNRTASKAQALETDGAKAFGTPAEAVSGADIIHITLKDDATVDEVLSQAESGLKSGAVIIDHTTTSSKGAIDRAANWKSKGFTYLHAPVFMGPPNALDGSGYMLVSGDQQVIGKAMPELQPMTGKVLNLGDQEGKAAAMKLVGNSFLLTLTAGLADVMGVGKANGVTVTDILNLFSEWNPGAAMPARLKRISEGKFDQPSWELAMARKDAGLMISAAETANVPLIVLPVIASVMDKEIEKGNGAKDWSIIAKDNIA